jgi:DNA-binding NtrC family response regulator
MIEKTNLLYVDDEVINLKLFEYNFKKKYLVTTALSAKAGMEILNNNPEIKIVISDMKMPEINGLEFIKIAKDKFPSINFFILTGFDITDEIFEALEKNLICKYFQKPFNYNEIDSSIDNLVN